MDDPTSLKKVEKLFQKSLVKVSFSVENIIVCIIRREVLHF